MWRVSSDATTSTARSTRTWAGPAGRSGRSETDPRTRGFAAGWADANGRGAWGRIGEGLGGIGADRRSEPSEGSERDRSASEGSERAGARGGQVRRRALLPDDAGGGRMRACRCACAACCRRQHAGRAGVGGSVLSTAGRHRAERHIVEVADRSRHHVHGAAAHSAAAFRRGSRGRGPPVVLGQLLALGVGVEPRIV